MKLSTVQSEYQLEIEKQQKHWQALCEKTKAEYEMVIEKLKAGHQSTLKSSKQSLISLEDDNHKLNKQLQSKEQVTCARGHFESVHMIRVDIA